MKRTYYASAERGRAILGYPPTRELAAISDRLDRYMEAVYGARLHFAAAAWSAGSDDMTHDERGGYWQRVYRRWAHLHRENAATCSYGGCLGPADGSECRHPREDD